jgi:hypothetical protein
MVVGGQVVAVRVGEGEKGEVEKERVEVEMEEVVVRVAGMEMEVVKGRLFGILMTW